MRRATLAAVSVLLIAPAAAQDKATIEKLNDAFEAAFNKGDFAAIGNMYAEDAYLLPPGSEMVKGRSNVQAFWTKAGEAAAVLILVDGGEAEGPHRLGKGLGGYSWPVGSDSRSGWRCSTAC